MTLWDRMLAALVLAGAAGSLFFFPSATFSGAAATASITVNGRVRQEISLDRAGVIRIAGTGGSCLAEFKSGDFRIKESDCPRRLCVRRGWAGKGGQPIICLPHRIVVTGRTAARQAGVLDAVVR